jgi:hypothetical protein
METKGEPRGGRERPGVGRLTRENGVFLARYERPLERKGEVSCWNKQHGRSIYAGIPRSNTGGISSKFGKWTPEIHEYAVEFFRLIHLQPVTDVRDRFVRQAGRAQSPGGAVPICATLLTH